MSTPSFDPEDPRLTAYALGEADEHERRAVESWLAESAEARAAVEQTRSLALALTTEYARENERYVASRPGVALPSNVVAFPLASTGRWPHVVAFTLKTAAVLVFTASLFYVGLRKSHHLATAPVASVPPGVPSAALPPSPVVAEPLSEGTQATGALKKDLVGSGQAAAVNPPLDAIAPSADAPPIDSDSLLAMAKEEKPADPIERASGGSALKAAPLLPAARRPAPAMLSDIARPAATATAPASSDEKVARSTVRVRCSDGRFFVGMILSPDGLILASTTLPENVLRQPCTVLLPDQSERRANAEHSEIGASWYWLRIETRGLSAASLATDPPADGGTLTVPVVDQASGELTFRHVQPSGTDAVETRSRADRAVPSHVESGLAYDLDNGILVFGTTTQPPLSRGETRTAAKRSVEAAPNARPFTATERAILRGVIERDEHR